MDFCKSYAAFLTFVDLVKEMFGFPAHAGSNIVSGIS